MAIEVTSAPADAPHLQVSARPQPAPGLLRPLGAWVAVFLALTAWHAECLTLPPYCDFAIGLFYEADWLLEHDYDYRKLRYEEKTGNEGGPRIYLTSVLPTLVALLMSTSLTTTGVMLVCHLVTIALAAWLLVSLFSILAPATGRLGAALACLATATTPLFSVQTEMIGLDLPMASFATAGALAALRGRFILAALAGAAAFAMKNTGLVPTAALAGYFVLLLLAGRPVRRPWASGLALAAVLAAQFWIFRWSGIGGRLTDAESMPFELVSFAGVASICPDLVLLTLACAVATLWIGLRGAWRGWMQRGIGAATRLRSLLSQLATGRGSLVLPWALVIGNVLAVALFVQFPVPRYFSLAVPFVYAVAALLLFAGHGATRGAVLVACAWIALNLVNARGLFFPASDTWPRNGPALERSHEYLADHRAIIDAMRVVEQNASRGAIVAGHPFALYLALPRLGYVTRPLVGYAMNPYTGPHFVPAAKLLIDRPRELLLVHVDNLFYGLSPLSIGPPVVGDEPLYSDGQPSALTVYRRTVPESVATDADLERWYLETFWYDRSLSNRPSIGLAARAMALRKAGLGAQAADLLRIAVENEPHNVDARIALAETLVAQGEKVEALAQALEANWIAPDDCRTLATVGAVRLAMGDTRGAETELQASLAIDPRHVPARLDLADVRLKSGDFAAAQAELQRCIDLEPSNTKARFQLGLAALSANQLHEAAAAFESLVGLAPEMNGAWLNLAEVYKRLNQPDNALDALRRAIDQNPADAALREAHGRLLLASRRLDEAHTQLREAVRLAPQSAEAHDALAVALIELGRWAEARAELHQALALRPDLPSARQNLERVEGELRRAGGG